MEEDSERRFEKIMGKLSQSLLPKPSSISSVVIGKKRVESGLGVSAANSTGMVPACRPWDRGDLMRRLATFKAMTWFGKPKAINAVNCARRGWVNVEMDVMACETCGARLLFSTPTAWNLQQVEKAAAVFSLKLDNGHKLLCPWKDNTCDEALALFPPTPPSVLVDNYKERIAELLRLTALPVVSLSAIEHMKSPQLEQFLSQSSRSLIALNNGMKLTDNPTSKDVGDASEDATANQYYQAQRIISLCGWEPRLLPYVVDTKDSACATSTEIPSAQKNSTIVHTSSRSSEGEGRINIIPSALGENQCDPASVVLDCKLCGACVGLWAFQTVQRPLESFSLIVDPNGQNNKEARYADTVSETDAPNAESSSKAGSSIVRPMVLNLSIAGGIPPTKQNYRPVVSFPIISRHLRADIASSLDLTGGASSDTSCGDQLNAEPNSRIEIQSGEHTNVNHGLQRSGESGLQGSDCNPEHEQEKALNSKMDIDKSIEVGKSICPTLSASVDGNNSVGVVDGISNSDGHTSASVNLQKTDELHSNNGDKSVDPSNIASCSTTHNVDKDSDIMNINIPKEADPKTTDVQNMALVPTSRKEDAYNAPGNVQPHMQHKIGEFDPIRQHRPFCPWIAPHDGKSSPGWKSTLSVVLQQYKDLSSNCLQQDSPSILLDEEDDPITSIRKLFASPPSKRLKSTH